MAYSDEMKRGGGSGLSDEQNMVGGLGAVGCLSDEQKGGGGQSDEMKGREMKSLKRDEMKR